MSKITKCDRCGVEVSDTDKFLQGMSHIQFSLEFRNTREYDLCPSCINELAHIVKEWVDKYGYKDAEINRGS